MKTFPFVSSISTLWRRLTEPAASVQGSERRREARLLSSLLLVIIPFGLLASTVIPVLFDPTFQILTDKQGQLSILADVTLVGAYALSRTRQYRWGAIFTLSIVNLSIWILAFVGETTDQGLDTLFYLPVIVFLSSLLLPTSYAFVLVLINMAGVMLYEQLIPRVTDSTGNPVSLLIFASILILISASIRRQDLLQLEEQSNKLIESEERLAKIFQLSPVGILVSRQSDGLILDANDAYQQIMGYSHDELIGHTVLELNIYVDPEEREKIVHQLQTKGAIQNYEIKARAKSGEIRDVTISLEPIELDGEQCMLAVSRDITKQKQGEEELLQSERRFQLAAWATKDVIWERDFITNTIWWNESLRKLFHYSGNEIEATIEWWEQHIHPDERVKVIKSIRLALEHGDDFWSKEYHFCLADGSYADIFDRGYILYDELGKPTRMIGAMMDITERKLAEKNLEEMNIKLAESVKKLEKRTYEMAMLSEMNHLLRICVTPPEAYAVVAQMAPKLFIEEAGVLFINSSSNLLENVASWGKVSLREGKLVPDDCLAAGLNMLYTVENTQSGKICRHLDDPLPAGYLCIPIVAQGETLGVLNIQSSMTMEANGDILPLVRATAESIGLTLVNLQLRETLRQQSIRDGLTGLFNRRYMEETLEREVHRAARNQEPLAIIMMDLDHFKKFNDTHGHPAGDMLLRKFGELLRSQTRDADIACRYGGEEFVLIMPGASLAIAQKRAESLCQAIKQINLKYNDKLLEAVTLSVGVSAYPETSSNGQTTVSTADSALYQAKHLGRDRVVAAEKILPETLLKSPQHKTTKSTLPTTGKE